MRALDDVIIGMQYILDCLRDYKDIIDSGTCNDCRGMNGCRYKPKLGQLVRYNCPFYERKEDTDVNVKS